MVSHYDHQVFSPHKVMTPLLESLDDGKEFPVIDVIVSFCQREGGRMIGTGTEISIGVFLHEHSSSGSEGSVCHDKEGFGGVRHLNYWGGKESFFEFDEHVVLSLSPMEVNPLLGWVVKWSGKYREVGDKLSIEVTASDEGSDCFY